MSSPSRRFLCRFGVQVCFDWIFKQAKLIKRNPWQIGTGDSLFKRNYILAEFGLQAQAPVGE